MKFMKYSLFLLFVSMTFILLSGCVEQPTKIQATPEKIIDRSFIVSNWSVCPGQNCLQFYELPGDGTYSYEVISDVPVIVTVMSKKDFELWKFVGADKADVENIAGCFDGEVLSISKECTIPALIKNPGIVIKNINEKEAVVSLKVFKK